MQTIIKIGLGVLIVVLGYLLFETIAQPIRFNKEKSKRYAHVKTRLIKIREAQMAFKSVHGKFATNFDDLINSMKNDNFQMIRTIGNPDDTTVVVQRDTFYISVKDSLFKNGIGSIDSLRYVPFTDNQEFEIDAGNIRKGHVKLDVFEVRDGAPYDPNDVYQVGSMADANFSGNWER